MVPAFLVRVSIHSSQSDLAFNPDRCDSWYTLGNTYFEEAGIALDQAPKPLSPERKNFIEIRFSVRCHRFASQMFRNLFLFSFFFFFGRVDTFSPVMQQALKCFFGTLSYFDTDPARLQIVSEANLMHKIGSLCYLQAKYVS